MTDGETLQATLQKRIAQWREKAMSLREKVKPFCYGGEQDGDMLDEDIGLHLAAAANLEHRADELQADLNAWLKGRGLMTDALYPSAAIAQVLDEMRDSTRFVPAYLPKMIADWESRLRALLAASASETPQTGLHACHVCGLIWKSETNTDCPACMAQAAMKAVSDLQVAAAEPTTAATPPDPLEEFAQAVIKRFEQDEADGYRSRDRIYAITMLKQGLALRASSPSQTRQEKS